MNLTMLGQINMLAGAAANLAQAPGFVNGLHLPANSPCRNTGTAAGAPTIDFENDARPLENAFDVGMDEYKP